MLWSKCWKWGVVQKLQKSSLLKWWKGALRKTKRMQMKVTTSITLTLSSWWLNWITWLQFWLLVSHLSTELPQLNRWEMCPGEVPIVSGGHVSMNVPCEWFTVLAESWWPSLYKQPMWSGVYALNGVISLKSRMQHTFHRKKAHKSRCLCS